MKINMIRNIIFAMMAVIFVLLVTVVLKFSRICGIKLPPATMLYLAGALFVLAAVLIALTIKIKESAIRKFFFILTGASAIGIPVCGVLHNVVYGLGMKLGWWQQGGDEAVFFILAIFVFPALFVIGLIGSIALLIIAGLKKETAL